MEPYDTGRFTKPDPDAVQTYSDFVRFLGRMSKDYDGSGHREWENHTLGDFLAALARYAHDYPQTFINSGTTMPDPPDWTTVAGLLYGATGYE